MGTGDVGAPRSAPTRHREVIISTGPGVPDLAQLREQLERDRLLLESLGPRSDRRLRRRIVRTTARLRDYEESRDRRDAEFGYTGLFFILIGAILTYIGWGSWWVLLGFGMLLLGVYWADRLRPR